MNEVTQAAPEEADVPALTLEERFELFTYEVQQQLNRMESMLVSTVVTTIAMGRVIRVTKGEIEEVEATMFPQSNPPTSETSAVDEGATPAVESVIEKEK